MRTDTSISPAEAAKLTGKNKTTITRAIDSGKLSAFRDDEQRLWIEPAELHRVFPIASTDAALVQNEGNASSRIASSDAPKPLQMGDAKPDAQQLLRIEALQQEISREREERDRERKQLEETVTDLRRRLDASEEERRQKDTQLTHLLTDQSKKEEALPRRRSLVERMLGGLKG